jgi:hypothetical protein
MSEYVIVNRIQKAPKDRGQDHYRYNNYGVDYQRHERYNDRRYYDDRRDRRGDDRRHYDPQKYAEDLKKYEERKRLEKEAYEAYMKKYAAAAAAAKPAAKQHSGWFHW